MRRRRALSEMVSFRRRLLVLIRVQRAVSRTVTMGSSATGRAGDRRRCTSDIGLTATAPLSQCPDINTSGTEWLPSAHATAAHDIGQHAAATARCGMLRGIYCGLLSETKRRRLLAGQRDLHVEADGWDRRYLSRVDDASTQERVSRVRIRLHLLFVR